METNDVEQTRGEVISEQTAETVAARRRTRRIAEEIEGGLQRRLKEEDKEDHERDRRRRTRRIMKEIEGGGHGGDRRTRRIVKEILRYLSDMQKYRMIGIRIYDNTDIQLSSEPLDCSLSLSSEIYCPQIGR